MNSIHSPVFVAKAHGIEVKIYADRVDIYRERPPTAAEKAIDPEANVAVQRLTIDLTPDEPTCRCNTGLCTVDDDE